MKHLPFDSFYRSEFEVVEERHGRVHLYPHTAQLPVLLRALNLEFLGGLPARIARVDRRGGGFDKIVRKMAGLCFCSGYNSRRPDDVRLLALLDHDMVSHVTIVQHIIKETHLGPCHRFRFYGGPDFSPEIYVSGKRLVFADHVLQRFNSRVPNPLGTDLSILLTVIFGSPVIASQVGLGRAFLYPYCDSILAFPFKETDDEYFVTTCLTVNEINSLALEFPTEAHNLHYQLPFTRPRVRNWFPPANARHLHRVWRNKVPLPPAANLRLPTSWSTQAHTVADHMRAAGHGPGSSMRFVDGIPGPMDLELRPGGEAGEYRELDLCKQHIPGHDWDDIYARNLPFPVRLDLPPA